jgi:hypothetical protein
VRTVLAAVLATLGGIGASCAREPHQPTVSGVVIDPDGRPIVAGIWRAPLMRNEDSPWVTGEDGRFEIPLLSRRFELVALNMPWAESEAVEVDGAAGRDVDGIVLRLRRPAGVEGRLLDDDGVPLAGVMLICHSGSLRANDWDPETRSDQRGRFEFERCDPGPAEIWGHEFFLPEGKTTEVVLQLTAEETHVALATR